MSDAAPSASSGRAPAGPWYLRLHFQIAITMAAGAVVGAYYGPDAERWFGWLGTIFIRLLKMVIVPLIVTSIVSGVSSVGGGRRLGRLGLKTMAFYMSTSLLAILVGLVVVNVLRPGAGADLTKAAHAELPTLQTPESVLDILVKLIPLNPLKAAAEGDMLAIIFFSILLGVGITQLPERSHGIMQGFCNAGFDLMMVVTAWVIRVLPLGVFGLIVTAVSKSDTETYTALGMYMVTIALGLTLHMLVTLPLLIFFVGRMSPLTHFRNMADALMTAFSTSSSSATLPVTMRTVEKKVGVSNTVSSFVLPMGATINMDGTALYECVGVMFIAQAMGYHLSFTAQMVVVLTALLASIGAAGIPSAGLVVIFIVTDAVNLRGPEVDMLIGMLLAIDRPLDMFRTMVNVFSDSAGAAIIARSEGETGVNAT